MLPTTPLPISDLASGDRTVGSSLNLLQDGASVTSGPFADELRVSLSSAGAAGDFAVPPGDEALPETGNALPPGLEKLVEELQAMQAELGPEALTEAELDVDLELTLQDLDLPAGLTLMTPLEQIQVSGMSVAGLADGGELSSAKTGVPQLVPPAASQINDLAELTRLSVNQLEAALERSGSQLSQDDLKLVSDALKRLAAGSENGAAARQGVAPASIVTVDGLMTEGRNDRFRTLGVGPLSTMPGELTPTSSSVRTELSNALAELARGEQAQLLKTQAGGFQVHATVAGVTNPAQLAASSDPASALATLSDSINTPVKDAAWGERLGERVLMMANNKLQNAELRLSPAEMGPLRIRLSMEDNAASVSFVAQNGATREAIESALPRLRTLLEEQGINLGQASVGEQSAEQQSDGTEEGERTSAFAADGDERSSDEETVSISTRVRVARGLLDTFV